MDETQPKGVNWARITVTAIAWKLGRCASVLLVIGIGLLLQPVATTTAQFFIEKTRYGRPEVDNLPSTVTVVVSELAAIQGTPPITHSHEMGWVYTVEGVHPLTVGDQTKFLIPKEAAWIPAGVEHTHDVYLRQPPWKIWFIAIVTDQLPVVPSGMRVLGISEPLKLTGPFGRLTGRNPYEVGLIRIAFPPAPSNWDMSATVFGPGVLLGAEGVVRFEDKVIRPGDLLTLRQFFDPVHPLVDVRNVSDERGAVLHLFIIPKN